jgi:hypothetical protein
MADKLIPKANTVYYSRQSNQWANKYGKQMQSIMVDRRIDMQINMRSKCSQLWQVQ